MYRLLQGQIDLDPVDFVSRSSVTTAIGHSQKLSKPQALSRIWRNALPITAINVWNALPTHVVHADFLTQFKSQLDLRAEYGIFANSLANMLPVYSTNFAEMW